jgi:hypothetical protein
MLEYLIFPLLVLGVILILAGWLLPDSLSTWKFPAQIAGTAILGGLLFYSGQTFESRRHEAEMAEAKLKISQLETKSSEVTIKTVTEYVDRIKYVDRVKIQKVKEFVTVADDEACKLNSGFVKIHDAAAGNELVKPDETDREESKVKLSEATEIINQNYLQYNQIAAQLTSLQNWVTNQEKLWNSTK